MTDISFVPVLVLALVVYTLTNLLKYIRAADWNAVVTLLAGWLIGIAAVWLVGATDWGQTITIGGTKPLDMLSVVEKVLVGLVVVSAGSTVFDLKKSFDRSDSAATPTLLPTPMNKGWTIDGNGASEFTNTTTTGTVTAIPPEEIV